MKKDLKVHEFLTLVADDYDDFEAYLLTMGANPRTTDLKEVIHEAALRVISYGSHTKIVVNDKINHTYFWRVLKSVLVDRYKKSLKSKEFSYDDVLTDTDLKFIETLSVDQDIYDHDKDSKNEAAIAKLNYLIDRLDDIEEAGSTEIFELYYGEGNIFSDLSESFNISKTSAFLDLTKSRVFIQGQMREEYESIK